MNLANYFIEIIVEHIKCQLVVNPQIPSLHLARWRYSILQRNSFCFCGISRRHCEHVFTLRKNEKFKI